MQSQFFDLSKMISFLAIFDILDSNIQERERRKHLSLACILSNNSLLNYHARSAWLQYVVNSLVTFCPGLVSLSNIIALRIEVSQSLVLVLSFQLPQAWQVFRVAVLLFASQQTLHHLLV